MCNYGDTSDLLLQDLFRAQCHTDSALFAALFANRNIDLLVHLSAYLPMFLAYALLRDDGPSQINWHSLPHTGNHESPGFKPFGTQIAEAWIFCPKNHDNGSG